MLTWPKQAVFLDFEAIQKTAKTGPIGDGKIFVSAIGGHPRETGWRVSL
jgi:nitrogen regulatory protein PII